MSQIRNRPVRKTPYASCSTCGANHKQDQESTECRHCRGWSRCSACEKRKPNDSFDWYHHTHRGVDCLHSQCRECRTHKSRIMRGERSRQRGPNHNARPNNAEARFNRIADVVAAYKLDSRLERLLLGARRAKVAEKYLDAASVPWGEQVLVLECLSEVRRFEAERAAKREAKAAGKAA